MDQGELSHDMARGAGKALPVAGRAQGNPRIDQRQRDTARAGPFDHVRPEFAFHEHARIGPPVIQKPPHCRARIQRCELVACARRQAACQDLGRGGGAGGDQEIQPRIDAAHMGDQRQHRKAFAHARRVKPQKPALGARQGGLAQPFAEPRGIGAMQAQLGADAAIGDAPQKSGESGIERQGKGARAAHQPPVWLMWRDMRPATSWRE